MDNTIVANNDMVYTFDRAQSTDKKSTMHKNSHSTTTKSEKYRLEGIIEQYAEQNKSLQDSLDKLLKQNGQLLAVEKNMNETLDMLKERLQPKDTEYRSLIDKLIESIDSKETSFFRMAFR